MGKDSFPVIEEIYKIKMYKPLTSLVVSVRELLKMLMDTSCSMGYFPEPLKFTIN
jgi:hypothetical protein